MRSFTFRVRVYYGDTDAGGIVYHASYLRYCERARVESLRELGIELTNLVDTQFVVKSMQIEFIQPAKLDNELNIVSEIVEVRGASIRYNQSVYWLGQRLCRAQVLIACLDNTLRPKRLPLGVFEESKA